MKSSNRKKLIQIPVAGIDYGMETLVKKEPSNLVEGIRFAITLVLLVAILIKVMWFIHGN